MEKSGSDSSAGVHVENMQRDGYTVIGDFLDAGTLAEVRAGLVPHLGQHRGRNSFEGFTTERVYTLVGRGRVFERLAEDERVLSLIGRFLQPNFLLSAAQAICIYPGEAEQGLHFDDSFYKVPRPRPALSVSMICAIDDFTAENGSTVIVPGSHTWGPADNASLSKASAQKRPLIMKAGSCVVFLSTLIHGGGANRSAAPCRDISILRRLAASAGELLPQYSARDRAQHVTTFAPITGLQHLATLYGHGDGVPSRHCAGGRVRAAGGRRTAKLSRLEIVIGGCDRPSCVITAHLIL